MSGSGASPVAVVGTTTLTPSPPPNETTRLGASATSTSTSSSASMHAQMRVGPRVVEEGSLGSAYTSTEVEKMDIGAVVEFRKLGTLPNRVLAIRTTLATLASADLARVRLRVVDAGARCVMPMEHVRLDASIPFSVENLHALRGFARPAPRALVSPDDAPSTSLLLRPGKCKNPEECEEDSTRVERWSRIVFVIIGIIFVIFVGIVITLMGMLYMRVNHVLDRVDGEEVNAMIGHAVASAKNTEETTANLARASSVAHALALQVQPSLVHVLNSTDSMIDQARNFAFHPQWTISGG